MYFDEKPVIKRVFLYTRKSSDEGSGKQIRSIDDQRNDCVLFAEKYGLEIVDEFTDEGSAHMPDNRPNFERMLEELKVMNPEKRRADGILAWHPDRLSRNALEAGVVLQMLDDEYIQDMFFVSYMFHNDSSGKEHLFMEFARAKGYSDKLSDVVLRGMTGREKEGALLYGGKFGYDKKREYPENAKKCSLFPIPSSIEFPIIRKAFELRRQGKTLNGIREYFKEHKIKNSNGRYPLTQSLAVYLSDTAYFGKFVVNKGKKDEREVDMRLLSAPDGTEFVPAVLEEDFWECQRIHNGDAPKPKQNKRQHPLRGGFLTCKTCNEHLYPAERKISRVGGIKEPQLGYECHTKECKQPRIKADVIFAVIEKDLKGGLGLTEREYGQFVIGARGFVENRRSERKQKRKKLTEVTNLAERDLENLEIEKAALVRGGEYDTDAKRRVENQKKKLKAELIEYKRQQRETDKDFESDLHTFQAFLELSINAHKYWTAANPDQKHRIAEIMLLNLMVDGRKVQSISYKKPFSKWLKGRKIHSGGRTFEELELWLEGMFRDVRRGRRHYQIHKYDILRQELSQVISTKSILLQ